MDLFHRCSLYKLLFVPIIAAIGFCQISRVLRGIGHVYLRATRVGGECRNIPRARIAKRHARKAGAASERRISDAGYAVGDGHARKAGANGERPLSDGGYAVGDRHTRKATARVERLSSDGGYAVAGRRFCGNYEIGIGTSADAADVAGAVTV